VSIRGVEQRVAQLAVGLVIGLAVAGVGWPAGAGGGSWFMPVKDRYEPGEEVTLIGYTGSGSADDGPFFGHLVAPVEPGEPIPSLRLPLGEIRLEATGRIGYLALRASITFTLPDDLAPGLYLFEHCNRDCTQQLGDLVGGTVHVGVDPEYPTQREWPLDEPEVANLDPDALLVGPGFGVTAGEVQRGEIDIGLSGLPLTAELGTTSRPPPPATDPSPTQPPVEEDLRPTVPVRQPDRPTTSPAGGETQSRAWSQIAVAAGVTAVAAGGATHGLLRRRRNSNSTAAARLQEPASGRPSTAGGLDIPALLPDGDPTRLEAAGKRAAPRAYNGGIERS
jgi:hypothetical protein